MSRACSLAMLSAFIFLVAAGCATIEASPETVQPKPLAQETAAGEAAEVAGIQVDEKAGSLSFGARVAKQGVYKELEGAIEYVVVFKGGKGYETVFKSPLEPMDIHEAMLKIGLKPGKPAYEEDGKQLPPEGDRVSVFVEWTGGGKERREPVESFVLVDGKPMEPVEWVCTGTREGWDPEEEKTSLQVVVLRNLIGLQHADGSVLLQNPDEACDEKTYKVNKSALPAEGTPVKIVFEAVRSGPE